MNERWRLNRYIAGCGIASRRHSEKLIEEGKVSVNGKIVVNLATYIDPKKDIVCVDGKRIKLPEHKTLILNKPRDYLCTANDPRGRRTIYSLLPESGVRLFSIGRLDRYSEGLIILTNDGDLANAISHPRNRIIKQYLVWLNNPLKEQELKLIEHGITSEGEFLKVISIENIANEPLCYKIKITEGKNRHIRRIFEALNYEIRKLKRIAIGPLKLKNLKVGQWRWLTNNEIYALYKAAGVEMSKEKGIR